MKALIIAAAAIVMTAGPSSAQSTQDERGYVTVGGGVAVSSDTTSGDVALEAGMRVAPNLFVFGSLGQFLGEMDAALADFSHPAAHRELKWDLARSGWIRDYLRYIGDSGRRALVERFLRGRVGCKPPPAPRR